MIAEISFSPYSGRYHIVRNIFQHSCSTGAERILLSTNATLVCGLSDIKSAVILSIFLSTCPVTDISATVTPIGVTVCTTVDLLSGPRVSPFDGDIFRGHQMRDQKRERGRFLGL